MSSDPPERLVPGSVEVEVETDVVSETGADVDSLTDVEVEVGCLQDEITMAQSVKTVTNFAFITSPL
jgi:hypothetical protein